MVESTETQFRLELEPRRGLTKGDWTIVACLTVVATGVGLYALGVRLLGEGMVYVGVAGLIGCVTNRIAIVALFDPWPSRRLRLPYTGLIELERPRIEEALANAAAETLLRPEGLAEDLRSSEHLVALRDEAAGMIRRFAEQHEAEQPAGGGHALAQNLMSFGTEAAQRAIASGPLMQALSEGIQRNVAGAIESEACYWAIRERFQKMAGPLGMLGHVTGVADYDDVTYRIIDSLRAELDRLWEEPERLQSLLGDWFARAKQSLGEQAALRGELTTFLKSEFREALFRAADHLERWDIQHSELVATLAEQIARRIDVRRVVRQALARKSTEEIKQLVMSNSRHHLAWLEVWGGVLGGLGGGLLWAISRLF